MSTVLVLLGTALIVAAVIASLRLDRKKGKSNCGGNCGCCEACGVCHSSAAAKGKRRQKLFIRKT